MMLLLAASAVISTLVFVVLNPVERKAALRDEQRLADVSIILEGLVEENSENTEFFSQFPVGIGMQIGTADEGCSKNCSSVELSERCFNANTELLKHIGSVPFDPAIGSAEMTGYFVTVFEDSVLVGSCESEMQADISVSKHFFVLVDTSQ